jgi:hypothetical protein
VLLFALWSWKTIRESFPTSSNDTTCTPVRYCTVRDTCLSIQLAIGAALTGGGSGASFAPAHEQADTTEHGGTT